MGTLATRREFLAGAAAAFAPLPLLSQGQGPAPLQELGYDQVQITGARQVKQRQNVTAILRGLDEGSLLKPFVEMAGGQSASVSLGGWYEWNPRYNHHHDDAGLAPASTFGQWTSAMARLSAGERFGEAAGDGVLAAKAQRLNGAMAAAVSTDYFRQTRFAGYSLDKLVCGLMDAHRLLGDPQAFSQMERVRAAAVPVLPGHAVDREVQWKVGADISWMWDETYTLPENLYLSSALGAGPQFRSMARDYLLDKTYFAPLAAGINALSDKHAYSYVNALCSAMQAWFVDGSADHLRAARNGFDSLEQQSFATGGWGPDELLRKPGYGEVAKSLTASHNGFETPCGSYAHLKLTRYLLRATRDGRYGDSMERVLHNTVLGALPLQADGRSFYSSDYNVVGKRIYSVHRWPCCSGTLPQVVADYGISSYLQDADGLWVNLYQPSEVRWRQGGVAVALEQAGEYPLAEQVHLRVTAKQPVRFAMRLRVPAWCSGATLLVNGRPQACVPSKGFATVEREWRTGDVVDLRLPMMLRLEPLPRDGATAYPDTVALMRGPLVLFALREPADVGPLVYSSDAMLKAEQTGAREWRAESAAGSRRFVPFTDVGDANYSTYVKLA